MFGNLVGAVVGKALSSIGPSSERLQARANKDQREMNRARFTDIVAGAQEAGFNPLTALRATGGSSAAMGTYESPLAQNAMMATAIGESFGEFLESQDPMVQERKDLEMELLRERVANAKAINVRGMSGSQTPLGARQQEVRTNSPSQFVEAGVGPDGPVQPWEQRVKIILPDGETEAYVPFDIADRVLAGNVRDVNNITMGEYVELKDVWAQVEGAFVPEKVHEHLTPPVNPLVASGYGVFESTPAKIRNEERYGNRKGGN